MPKVDFFTRSQWAGIAERITKQPQDLHGLGRWIMEEDDALDYPIELAREPDGRWVATMPRIPGLVVYEQTREDALITARKLRAILLDEAMRHDGRILAFYPGCIPDSLRQAFPE